VVDDLQRRPWGASDGQVRDRYGVRWLIGYEHGTDPSAEAVTSGAASSEVPSSEV
jgi:PhnB protein